MDRQTLTRSLSRRLLPPNSSDSSQIMKSTMPSHDFFSRNESVLILLSRLLDAVVVGLSGWLAFATTSGELALPTYYQGAIALGALFTFLTFPVFNQYQSWRGRTWIDQLRAITGAVLADFVLLLILSALLKMTAWYSRLWFAAWFGVAVVSLFAVKRFVAIALRQMRSHGWNQKNIVIYGAGELGQMVAERLRDAEWTGFAIKAFIDDEPERSKLKPTLALIPVHGKQTDLETFVQQNQIRELWFALPLRAEERVREILFSLRHSTVQIRFVPNIFSFKLLLGHSISDVAGIPVVDINSTPISGLNRIAKEIEDRVLAAVILLCISPLMALIAVAIRLESRGPALYKQERHGWDGKVIKVYKFRSMRVLESASEFTQVTKDDPRITRIGAFIRKTSLDELPQFFNVLQGRMSIVGPRPHAVKMNDYYKDKVDYYFQRHKVKPGITGWAQINGCRGETDTLDKMEKRIQLDLQYIQNWSVWLDLKIIFLTIFKGFVGEKVY